MKKIIILLSLIGLSLTSACTMNRAVREDTSKQYYFIFDITPRTDSEKIITALENSLNYNIESFTSDRPIPSENLPEKPGRFKVVNPFKNSNMAAFINTGKLKSAVCDGDGLIYTATASKKVGADYMKVTVCLWEYKKGYSLDFYALVNKGNGSLTDRALTSLVSKAIISPEEWAKAKAFHAVRSLEKEAGVTAKIKISYPKVSGTPWRTSFKGESIVGP